MRSTVARGVKGLARGTQTIVSQVIVSVVTALCVAFIGNAYLGSRADPLPEIERAANTSAPAAPQALPPLDVEVIADVPSAPAPEVFPGVPAGMSPDVLKQTVAVEQKAKERKERRRFLGIPLPFGTAAAEPVQSAAGAAIDAVVRGG